MVYKNRGRFQKSKSQHGLPEYAKYAYEQRVQHKTYRAIAKEHHISQKTIAKSVKIWKQMPVKTKKMFGQYFGKGYLTAKEWAEYTGNTPVYDYYLISLGKQKYTGESLDFYFRGESI